MMPFPPEQPESQNTHDGGGDGSTTKSVNELGSPSNRNDSLAANGTFAPLPSMKKRPRGGGGEEVKEEKGKKKPFSSQKNSFSGEGIQGERQSDDVAGGGGSGGERKGREKQGRTCVACRISKVKCSRGLPCDRCTRLKLVCVAQIRGRGRPVTSPAAKKSLKPEHDVLGNGKSATANADGATGRGIDTSAGAPRASNSHHTTTTTTTGRGSPGASSFSGNWPPANPSLTDGSESMDSSKGGGSPLGFSSPVEVPPQLTVASQTTFGSSHPLEYTTALRSDGSYRADNGGGGGGVGKGAQLSSHAQQHFVPRFVSAGLPLSSATAQQQQQYGAFQSGARPLAHGCSGANGSSGLSDVGGMTINCTASGSTNSGSSWRGVFHSNVGSGTSAASVGGTGEDSTQDMSGAPDQWEYMSATSVVPARVNDEASTFASATERFLGAPLGRRVNSGGGAGDGRGESGRDGSGVSVVKGTRSSLTSDSGFNGGKGLAPMLVETMEEHRHAVAGTARTAATAAAGGGGADIAGSSSSDGDTYLSKSVDKEARWLLDVEQGAGASGADSMGTSPEANGGAIDPTDAIASGFWKLFSEQEVQRPKAVLVIRHWALCALDRRSTNLMRETVNMARALSIDVAEILNDYSIYSMFHELLQEAENGNTIEPAPPAKLGIQEAPPYIQELSSKFAAVSICVVLRGQSTFCHNDVCSRLFLTTEEANELYSSKKQDVWATCIHPDDHKGFFDDISIQLFRSPAHQSEFKKIFKCRDQTGFVFLALVHFRYDFRDDGNYAAFGLSMLPLPPSDYMQTVDQPATVENRRGGGVKPQPATSKPLHQIFEHQGSGGGCGVGGAGAAMIATTPCSLSSPRSGFSSCAPSSRLAAVAAGAPACGGRGTGVLLRPPLPPLDLDVMPRRVGAFVHGSVVDSVEMPGAMWAGAGAGAPGGFSFSSRLLYSGSGKDGECRDSWGDHGPIEASAVPSDMGRPVELDDSFHNSRGSGGFQIEVESGVLEPGSVYPAIG